MISPGEPERGSIGIFTTDTDLVVRSWDASLVRMTGIPEARAVGARLEELVPTLVERAMLDLLREPLVSGAPVVLAAALHKYLIPCAPLEPSEEFDRMQQRVVIGALKSDAGQAGIVVTIEDVTPRLERERRLARALNHADPAARLAAVKQLESGDPDDAERLTGVIGDDDWRVRRAAVAALRHTRDAALVTTLVHALRDGHRNFSLLSSALQLLSLTGLDLTDALTGLLQDPDADLRIQAALALGTQRSPAATAALISALDDPDANVRFHAIEALGKHGASAAIERLVECATSGDFFLSFPAIEALVRIGDPVAAESLMPLLSDPMLGTAAAEALGRLGDETIVEALASSLEKHVAATEAVTSAIAAIYRRCARTLGGALGIEDRVARALSPAGAAELLRTMAHASGDPLRDMALVVGWLDDPGVAPALARLLASPVAHDEAVEALVRVGSPAVDLLIAQLFDHVPEARRAAAVALGRIGDRRAVPGLIALLREDARDTWLPAIAALASIGDGRAFLPLLGLLGDADAGVRQAATGALNSIGHPEMEHHIAELLESADPRTRESAVKIAGYFGYPSCVRPFLARCHDEHEGVRCAALEHLPYFDEPGTLDVLKGALENDTPRARAAAAQALGAMPDREARTLLEDALTDDDAWVRYFAAISLGRRHDAASIAKLVQSATTDGAHHVRVAAIEALGAIGGGDALGAIEPLTSDEDRDVGHAAMRVLGRLGWPRAIPILAEALRSSDPRRRIVAADALAAAGGLAAIDPLRWAAAADADDTVATAALSGLVGIANAGGPAAQAAVDACIALTLDPRRRDAAVDALARVAPVAIPWLAAGLQADDPRARIAVVDALARLLHPSATACLQRALDDPDEGVRQRAVSSLARIGSRGVAERLAALAERDSSALVRQVAAAALARSGQGRGGGV